MSWAIELILENQRDADIVDGRYSTYIMVENLADLETKIGQALEFRAIKLRPEQVAERAFKGPVHKLEE